MPKSICIITADEVIDTGTIGFRFIFDSGIKVSDDLKRIWDKFGFVYLRPRGVDEIDLRELGDKPSLSKEDAEANRWQINIGKTQPLGQIFSAVVPETLGTKVEEGLCDTLKDDFPNCVLLMHVSLKERFLKACEQISGLEVNHHHFNGTLFTHK